MKQVSRLTIKDFEIHPILTWAGDDEDLVCPIDRDISDLDAIFVLTDLWFNNDAYTKGFAAIRMQDKQVY